METLKHWTYYLPEAGTIVRKGISQLTQLSRIKVLQEQLEELEKQYNDEEDRLVQLASEQWTLEEIFAAKNQVNIEA
jgi:predicted nuclease with TOPRIM domain